MSTSSDRIEAPQTIGWWWIAVPVVFTVTTLLTVDMAGSAAFRQLQIGRAARALLEAEVQQEPYRGTTWGRRYWENIERYQERWDPYYVYRVGSMTTEFINVSNGVRATYRAAEPRGGPARLVFLFGGSAAWGHGARDEGTIPSWIAKVAEEHGDPLDVRNLAESGWVNWQGIAYLSQLLADGARPDTVIFYSGVNEVLGGRSWPHIRRPIWNAEAVPRAMSDWALERNRPFSRFWDYYRNTSYLWTLVNPRPSVLPAAPAIARPESTARLVDEYLADRSFVEQLGRVYGFKTIFAWQLTVADKPVLSAQERSYAGWLPRSPETTPAIDWWVMDGDLKSQYEEVGRRVKARGVLDVTPVLKEVPSSTFIDWMHMSEAGNERVARALYEHLRTALAAERTAPGI